MEVGINSPILVLIFCGSIPCVFCGLYTILKAISHYVLSVLCHVNDGFP